MRKFLLASVATLGTGGLTGAALAQTPPGAPVPTPLSAPAPMAGGTVGAPTQGQQAWSPAPAPMAYVNNNNNYQAPALPGALANPTPGTIVVHFNGKVQVDAWRLGPALIHGRSPRRPARRERADHQHRQRPLALGFARPRARRIGLLGNNGTGTAKLQPQQSAASRASMPAVTAWRPTACVTVQRSKSAQNFTGQVSNNGSSGAARYSSLETLYVRRAFTYVAGEQLGHRARRPGRRPDRHLRQRRDHLPVPADRQLQRRRPAALMPSERAADVRIWCPGRQRVRQRRSWSICRRRSPGSTSACSMRRTRRMGSVWAVTTSP